MIIMKYVGQRVSRVDGIKKVTGDLKYTDDLKMPGMLHAAVKRSPYAHANIIKLDTSKAESLPGVKAVITGKDVPKRAGLYLTDKHFLAVDKVRFFGEGVAAVAAETWEIAQEAIELIEVEYEELPAVLNAVDGMKPDAPLIHPELENYRIAPVFRIIPGTNVSEHFMLRKGDVDKAFEEADFVFENEFYVPHIQHSPIENHVAIAKYDRDGSLTVWASCQSPYAVRAALSDSFDIPYHKLRVISPSVGGGFGAKAGTTLEGVIIPLAMRTGRPVKLSYSREEEFTSSYVRQAMTSRFKTGVMKDGRIVAIKNEFIWDGGAFNEYGVNIAKSAGYSAVGPYDVPNIWCDSYCVYTNHPVGGPYRGFGMAEIHFGIEQNLDAIAHKLGIDPVKIRTINAQKPGGFTATGAKVDAACSYVECVEKVAEDIGFFEEIEQPKNPKIIRARGIAGGMKAPSMPTNATSSAVVRINEDGTAYLSVSAQDIGQGSDTTLTQIAAEILSIPPEKITINTGDTAHTPYEWQTVASRITYSAGNAVIKACEDAREQLFKLSSIKLGLLERDLKLEDGYVVSVVYPDRKVSVAELALGLAFEDGSGIHGPIIGRGVFTPANVRNFDPETGLGDNPVTFWTYGANGVEIEVDTETGKIKVLKVAACWDVGKVVNPTLIEGQVEGAIVQGMGSALYEEIKLKDGKFLNKSFTDYKIPSAGDMPEMKLTFLENPQWDGPFGARAIAEPAMVPSAPAIANALYNGLGIRLNQMPFTAERVLNAIKEKKNN